MPRTRRALLRLLPRLIVALLPAILLVTPASAGGKFSQGLLWRIEVPGAAPSHVFGTFHITDPRIGDAAAPAARVLGKSHSLTIEVLLDQRLQAEYARRVALTEGRTLDAILGESLFNRVADIAGDYGYGPGMLKHLKPWAVMAMLSTPPREENRRNRGQQALDAVLERLARRSGIPIHALETAEEQLSLFDDLPETEQVSMLEERVAKDDEFRSDYEAMIKLYRNGQIGRLYELGTKQIRQSGSDDLLKRFLLNRNHAMVQRMQPQLKEGAALIAVGALHLGGEEGVLNLLRKRGYRLTRAD